MRNDFLRYAVKDYMLSSSKTQLVERYLTGFLLTQMSGVAVLKNMGKMVRKLF
jgi:hypothetical protein